MEAEDERNELFSALYHHPGWKEVLNILREEVKSAEYKVTRYKGSDQGELLLLLGKLRGKSELLQVVETQVRQLAELAGESHPLS